MPVQFVVGRAGTGKTYRTLDLIADHCRRQPLGRPIWLLVPRQATFEYERALVARLGGFARVRVVGMEALGQAVLDEVGGMAVPQVSAAGRRMVIGRLLWRHHHELQYFASSARRPGLAHAVDDLFDDFERSGQPLDQLDSVMNQFGETSQSPSLHAKLADLRLLYSHYQHFIGQDRLDPEKRRQEITRRLGRAPSLAGSTVYVDAFYEFTENERLTLAEIAAVAERMEINLTLPADSRVISDPLQLPDDLSPFHRTEVAYQRVYRSMHRAGVPIDRPHRLVETRRFQAESLRRIEAAFGAQDAATESGAPPEARSAVEFIEAPDTRCEVQRVAACIGDLIRTEGYRRRDIQVLVRTMGDYLHLIHAAFTEHCIPYFADRRRPATHHPLIRFIRAAVWIVRDRWNPDAVIALCKTELSGLTQSETDRLENHIREFGITEAAWLDERSLNFQALDLPGDEEFSAAPGDDPAQTVRPAGTQDVHDAGDAGPDAAAATAALPPADRDLDAIRQHLRDRLNPLVPILGRNAGPATLRSMAVGVGQVIEAFGIRQTLGGWIEQESKRDPEQAGEHEQVWIQFQDLLQEMVDVLGDEEVHPSEFVEVLETGLDGFDLAIPPATLDQVLVGSVDRTRSVAPKVVFVLGLSRGMFPAVHRDQSLLSGPERRELQRRQIAIDADIDRKQLDELFLAYIAFTRASHRLILSRPEAAARGTGLEPSELWIRLRAALPHAPVEQCQQSPIEQLSTPRALVDALLSWTRQLGETDAVDETAARDDWRRPLYDWLAHRPRSGDQVAFGTHGVVFQPRRFDHSPAGSINGLDANNACTALDRLVRLAWPSLTYQNRPTLSDDTAHALFAPPLAFTAAQLESFAACPFQHFAGYGLRLRGRRTDDITAMELSRIYHDVLHGVVTRVVDSNTTLADFDPDQLSQLVSDHVRRLIVRLHGARFLTEPREQYLASRIRRMLDMVFSTIIEQLKRGDFKPARVSVSFGRKDSKIDSPPIVLPDGSVAHLHGQIDRIDMTPDLALAVYDYRLTEQRLSMAGVFHGLALRLLSSMLVLDRAGLTMRGRPMTPVAGLTTRLRRSLQDVDHPSEAMDPASPEFVLESKPRGVIRDTHAKAFDKQTQTGMSPVVAMYLKKDGTFGLRDKSDIAEEDDLRLLLDFVERKVAELAGQLAGGEIAVAPYWFNEESPCPRCDFRSVCRFETPVNRYRGLVSLTRDESLQAMKKQVGR